MPVAKLLGIARRDKKQNVVQSPVQYKVQCTQYVVLLYNVAKIQ